MALLFVTTTVAWIAPAGSSRGLELLGSGVSLTFTVALTFGLLIVAYSRLPNTRLTAREVLPGAVFTTVTFQGSFQLLPLYLQFGESVPTLEAFGGLVLLLVWLYVLCNVFLLGAEINWWYGRGRHEAERARAGTSPELSSRRPARTLRVYARGGALRRHADVREALRPLDDAGADGARRPAGRPCGRRGRGRPTSPRGRPSCRRCRGACRP